MIRLAASDIGDGPVVVLVHGVGIGAWAFTELAAALAADHRVLVPHRRGYGPAGDKVEVPRSASVAEQVDDLLRLADARDVAEAVWVGVSGGATLVLALAMSAPEAVRAAVVHEPVFGPLAPDLHRALEAAATRLASAPPGPAGVGEFMAGLVGEDRLATLAPEDLQAVLGRHEVVRAEVPEFIAFAPSAADLARLSPTTLVATVGRRSPEWRQRAAAVLGARAGARVEVLDRVRHLPQIEAPEAFEKVVRGAAGLRAD